MVTYLSVFVQDQSRWVRVNFLGVYIHVVGGVINHCYVRYDMLVVRVVPAVYASLSVWKCYRCADPVTLEWISMYKVI